MKRPVVQVLVDDTSLSPVLNGALQRVGADIDLGILAAHPYAANRRPFDARILLTSDARSLLKEKAARVRAWVEWEPTATLVLSDAPADDTLLPTALQDRHELAISSNPSEDELAGRLRAMCGLSPLLRRFRQRATVSETRAAALRERIEKLDEERRLASTLQRELLPRALPRLRQAELVVLYEPADLVAGDLYDVFRLDDEHIGLSLIDATGHGVAAALVASFAGRRLRSYVDTLCPAELLQPDAPLVRMNKALFEADMRECHFVAALYVIYNERTQVVRWARGGACYPILMPRQDEPRLLHSAGPLVGIGPDAAFDVGEVRLRSGDSLFLHTDGMDSLPAPTAVTAAGKNLADIDWLRRAQAGSVRDALRHIESRIRETRSDMQHRDDVTVIGLQSHRAASIPASQVRPTSIEEAREVVCG